LITLGFNHIFLLIMKWTNPMCRRCQHDDS